MRRRHLELILDLTSTCNIRCVMCYFSITDRLRFKPFDLDPEPTGNIELTTFQHVASELFPRAHTVAFGCAAEPLLHPHFAEILRVTRTYRVPKVWVQTNLLALSVAKAQAIVDQGVRTVAVSIDGTSRETYERIRVGASWDRLLSRLELLRQARSSANATFPLLRVTFAWMRSNRHELKSLPAFAESLGAREIDVRFVAPTVGVDNRDELFEASLADDLMADLWSVARDAAARGIRLNSYPAMEAERGADNSLVGKIQHKVWLLKSGIDRPARWRRSVFERFAGCSFPGRMFLIRPNGAVLPCPFWQEEPIALVPRDHSRAILESVDLTKIRNGLRTGCLVESCRTCGTRKDALFRPLMNAGERSPKPCDD
jgi:MoaA/NifB/PqqE/SkfB family radical SAM enzyme